MSNQVPVPRDPSLEDLPTEEAVALLTQVYGESEMTARLMVGIAKGEIEGDALPSADDTLDRSSSRGKTVRARTT